MVNLYFVLSKMCLINSIKFINKYFFLNKNSIIFVCLLSYILCIFLKREPRNSVIVIKN